MTLKETRTFLEQTIQWILHLSKFLLTYKNRQVHEAPFALVAPSV